ncbi:MAG: low molecular weight phosphatase family protein [Proteobacteria bacterium]|nr:low molecular weight phosphatase family protein [Pseudomonadota bacterium]
MTQRILFLCDRNSVRSPMAAALLSARVPAASVASAGLMPDDAVNPFAIGAMLENGVDISGHTPVQISPENISPDILVITLTRGTFDHARQWRKNTGFELEFWDLPDVPEPEGPRDLIVDGFRAIREALKAHIRNRFGS